MIKIENIHKRFGKVDVLKGVDLTISQPGIFAILGPNGSGKTTLIKSILGLVIPDKGDIKVNDKSVLHQWNYRKHIDYLPQIAQFPNNLRVDELIGLIKDLRDQKTRDQDLIELFELKSFLNKKLGHLSGGTRQKVNLVLAFMCDSPLMILDEPTTGLDPLSTIRLKELLKAAVAQGKTILITSHIMSFVEENSDEIVFLLDGKIYFRGAIAKIKEDTQMDNLESAIAVLLKNHHV
ncbi:MAG: ABC transporter ATP-binding protein [Chitinophagales bacterium]